MKRVLYAVFGCLLAVSEVFGSDATFPTRTVTIIVPYAPGGGTDILARLVAQQLERRWSVPVVVENRAGGGGVVGAAAAVRAPADGYTLLLTGMTTLTANVALYKKLSYDPAAYLPVAMAAATPFVLVVNPSLPVADVEEFIRFTKGRSELLPYATTGPGAPHHLFMELFMARAGTRMSAVPYKGTAPALADVIGGHVPAMLADLGPAIAHIKSGKVRALGVSTAQRVGAISEVPPINDQLPNFDVASWQVFTVPTTTPERVVNVIHLELKTLLAEKSLANNLPSLGMIPMRTGTIEEMKAFVEAELVRWGDIVQTAGLRGSL